MQTGELLPEAWSPNYDMTALLRIAECGYPVKDVPEIWKRKAGSLRDFTDIAARYDPRRPNVLLEREARRRARALLESRYPDRRKPSAENTAPRADAPRGASARYATGTIRKTSFDIAESK